MEVLDQSEFNHNGKSLEKVLADGYSFNMGEYINRGFRLFGNDAGSYIGFFIVSFLISFVIGLIPFIGWIGGLIVGPALHAGWYIYARLHSHQMSRSFSNFFDGFKGPVLGQLIVASIMISIFSAIVVAAILIPTVGVDLISTLISVAGSNDPTQIQEFAMGFMVGRFVLYVLLASLAGAMIFVFYCLTPMFIVFRGMAFWPAMEASRKVVSKHYFQFLIFLIVLGILMLVGALLCGLGLLVAMPVFYLSMYAAFEDIMGVEGNKADAAAGTI